MFPFKMVVVGSLPAQYLGRGPGPLEIGLATTVGGELIGTQFIYTPPSTRTPLLARLFFPCTVHHQPKRQSTTPHWSRVLHHIGGPNQYKSCVSYVVHRPSLEIAARLRACFGREKSSCAPRCSNLKGFAGTRYPTFGAPGRGAPKSSFH